MRTTAIEPTLFIHKYVERNTEKGNPPYLIRFSNPGKGYTYTSAFRIYRSPFSNCQSFSIAMAHLLTRMSYYQVLYILNMLRNNLAKRLLIIDINEQFIHRIKETFKPFIISRGIKVIKYTSTNKSKMAIMMIRLDLDSITNQHIIVNRDTDHFKTFQTINHNN